VASIDAGYLVEYGDKSGLVDAIQDVLDNPDKARNRTEIAKLYIETNLSVARQTEKYESLYTEAVAAHKSRASGQK